MAEPSEVPEEFSNSVAIERAHRYAIMGPPAPRIYFGLLGEDGQLRRFNIDPDAMPALATELRGLSRGYRHVARNGTLDGYIPETAAAPPLWADGLLPPYVGGAMKLHRAVQHLDDLEDVLLQYSRQVKLAAEHVSSDGTNTTWRISFSAAPPASIPLIVGDIAHNLRSSLDILIGDLARLNGVSGKQLKFPFAENEAALKEIVRTDKHRKFIGDAATDAILSLRPYKGGNLLLRGLHDLNIIDKHRLVLPTYSVAWQKRDFAKLIQDQIAKQNPGAAIPKLAVLDDGTLTETFLRHGETITCPAGEDPLRYLSQHERGVEARFAGPLKDLAFAEKPVVETLGQLTHLVAEIGASFEASFPVRP